MVTLGHCNDSDIPQNPDLGDYFIINPVSNMWCVKDFFSLEMQESLGLDSDFYEYISLTIKKCKDSDEIDDFLIIMSFICFIHLIMLTRYYDRPLNQHGNFMQFPTKSLVFIEYQHLFVNTDDGVVLKDTLKRMSFSFNNSIYWRVSYQVNFYWNFSL